MEIIEVEDKKEKRIKRNEESLRHLWNNIMQTNIHITGIPEREEREKGSESIFEDIVAENFPNSGKETDIQVQAAQRVPHKMIPKRSSSRRTVIKRANIKDGERILKVEREKQLVTYASESHSVVSDSWQPHGLYSPWTSPEY